MTANSIFLFHGNLALIGLTIPGYRQGAITCRMPEIKHGSFSSVLTVCVAYACLRSVKKGSPSVHKSGSFHDQTYPVLLPEKRLERQAKPAVDLRRDADVSQEELARHAVEASLG
jgi:hypothetical protein